VFIIMFVFFLVTIFAVERLKPFGILATKEYGPLVTTVKLIGLNPNFYKNPNNKKK